MVWLAAAWAGAATRYVALTGAHSAPFTNWVSAATNIQAAVDVCSDGDEVVVTNGVYATGGAVQAGVSNRVCITKAIVLRSVNGPAGTSIVGNPDANASNGPAAVRGVYMLGSAFMSGFTISNGYTAETSSGGGVYMEYGATLSNSVVSYNYASSFAGGVFCGTQAMISACVIYSNSACGYGGGAFCMSTGAAVNCIIENNTAYRGGGAFCSSGGMVSNSTLQGNTAILGGGVYCDRGRVVMCKIRDNTAPGGGGVYCAAGTISQCDIARNKANIGGGVQMSTHAVVGAAAIHDNVAEYGGGIASLYASVVQNCTVTDNRAWFGAGIYLDTASAVTNTIVYHNTPRNVEITSALQSFNYVCCPELLHGVRGNITNDPLLLTSSHLATNSPCRGAGLALGPGCDLDGESWKTPPAMGCDEVWDNALSGALTVAIGGVFTEVAPQCRMNCNADIDGKVTQYVWRFDDRYWVTNCATVIHAWNTTGMHAVILTAYNTSYPAGVSATALVSVIERGYFVNAYNPTPAFPYTNWAAAATVIQDAVDACIPGNVVLVSNGNYATGGRTYFTSVLSNRVVIAKPLTLRSVNGPELTSISGERRPTYPTNGLVRCIAVYADDAIVSGFTLSNGTTDSQEWLGPTAVRGGGALLDAASTLDNCIIRNCSAQYGAGVCALYPSTVSRCTIMGCDAELGAGVYCEEDSLIINSVLYNNFGLQGSAVYCRRDGTLSSCTAAYNWNVANGVAVYCGENGTAINSIIYGSSANIVLPNEPGVTGTIACAYCCCPDLLAGTNGNISVPPEFVVGDYRLAAGSPCINAGTNLPWMSGATDRAGNPRVQGGRVDMGAYESVPEVGGIASALVLLGLVRRRIAAQRQSTKNVDCAAGSLVTCAAPRKFVGTQ